MLVVKDVAVIAASCTQNKKNTRIIVVVAAVIVTWTVRCMCVCVTGVCHCVWPTTATGDTHCRLTLQTNKPNEQYSIVMNNNNNNNNNLALVRCRRFAAVAVRCVYTLHWIVSLFISVIWNEFSCEPRAHGWFFFLSTNSVCICAVITINGYDNGRGKKSEKRKTCCWCIFIDFRLYDRALHRHSCSFAHFVVVFVFVSFF